MDRVIDTGFILELLNAVVSGERRLHVLERFTGLMNAEDGNWSMFDLSDALNRLGDGIDAPENIEQHFNEITGFNPIARSDYFEKFARHDRRLPEMLIRQSERILHHRKMIQTVYVDDDDRAGCPFLQYLDENGVKDQLGARLSDRDMPMSGVAVASRSREFGQADIDKFAAYVPFFVETHLFYRKLHAYEQLIARTFDVLDQIAHGIVLMDASGTVLHANRAAEEFLGKDTGLKLSRQRLSAAHSSEQSQLQSSITINTRREDGVIEHANTVIPISKISDPRPYQIFISHVPRASRFRDMERTPVVIAHIHDPEKSDLQMRDELLRLFELKPRHLDVVIGLANGLKAPAIARLTGKKHSTIRAYIDEISEILDCKGELEIAALVNTSILRRVQPGQS